METLNLRVWMNSKICVHGGGVNGVSVKSMEVRCQGESVLCLFYFVLSSFMNGTFLSGFLIVYKNLISSFSKFCSFSIYFVRFLPIVHDEFRSTKTMTISSPPPCKRWRMPISPPVKEGGGYKLPRQNSSIRHWRKKKINNPIYFNSVVQFVLNLIYLI